MSEELWGVFFEDSGREYLVAVFDDEDEASNDAEERDQQQFESALEMDDEAREVASSRSGKTSRVCTTLSLSLPG